jgi:hypothetical protein
VDHSGVLITLSESVRLYITCMCSFERNDKRIQVQVGERVTHMLCVTWCDVT